MYNIARAEMVRIGYRLKDVAPKMNITESTLSLKLNGRQPITLLEAKQFKKIVKSDLPLEKLFEDSEEAE